MVHKVEPERICSPRVLRCGDQPNGFHNLRPRYCICVMAFDAPLTLLSLDLVDAITKDWGGKPFVDLQKGWKYALDKYPEIDSNRAVAAGASWGGYAIK